MPFTVPALSGAALTTLTLSLTLSSHQHHRLHQSHLLRQSTTTLNNIITPAPEPPIIRERIQTAGVAEAAKDRWNGEVENAFRKLQGTDWAAYGRVAEAMVRGVGVVVGRRVREAGGEEVEERVVERVGEVKGEAVKKVDEARGKVGQLGKDAERAVRSRS